MKLLEILDESVIKVPLESEDKEEAVEELIDVLVRAGRITDREAALTAVMEREKKQTTGIGHGLAIPHAKHESITALTGAVGIAPEGIEFDSIDGEQVKVVFLLLAEADNPGPHLAALAEVARIFEFPTARNKLFNAGTPGEVLEIIRGI
ncbi:MAG: PTS sugar transporter subunit IIA [Planctomycetota bacterium]|nr:MAG: PTS sugar transporter subunit IIA [Planctomycetota bacterium]